MLGAIERKKIVVTGNKALLAEHGKEIFDAATRTRCRSFSRRRSAGGIPIIKAIREGVRRRITSSRSTASSTARRNYILTRMTEAGMGFAAALAEAQAAGYAEADPTLDVNGWDAAHKAIILASLAYGFWVPMDKIFVEGIEQLTASDICFARRARLPDQAARHHQGRRRRRDRGARASDAHPEEARARERERRLQRPRRERRRRRRHALLRTRRGAGRRPRARSSPTSPKPRDALQSPRRNLGFMPHGLYGTCKPIDEIVSEYYLRLRVEDRPGVIAQIAGILGELNIGISSILQPESEDEGATVPLVLMIHKATQRPDDRGAANGSLRSPA